MKRAARLALVVAVALGAPVALPSTASAQQPTKAAREEAGTRFKKGLEYFKDGDYQAALIEFRRAYELAPNWGVLYNIGQVSFQLSDYAGALSSLERYLAEGGNQVPAARRDEVKKDIEKLRGRVANLEVTTNVEGAEVLIDDVSVGKTPLAKPLLVSAGRRKVTATKEGRIPSTKTMEVAGGDSLHVQLDLVEPAPGQAMPPPAGEPGPSPTPPTAPPPPAPPPPATDAGGSSVPWIGWAVTGGLTAGAVVCGILALGASSDLTSMRETAGQTREGLDEAQSKTVTLALVTDILAGAAIVAGGISLYFTVSGSSSSAEPAATAKSRPAGELKVGVTPGGVKLLGTF